MGENPESGLANDQFGFRKFRSTCDALFEVYNDIRRVTDQGGGW